MEISYDAGKREWTLREWGLDFDDAVRVFAGTKLTIEDDRRDYGEQRFQTMGRLDGRLVMLVWTPRNDARHIISMRKANDREQKKFDTQLE